MTYKNFSYYHIHHGLTQEKFGRKEARLAPLTPLPTILSKTTFALFCPPEKSFRNSLHNFYGSEDPDSLFRFLPLPGFPSLIRPRLLPISNYASASPFWKSTGSHRFPNTPSCLSEVFLSNSRQWYWFRLHDLNKTFSHRYI